ncbi:malto-oligosyltrehalose synthase, partial [Castellaniella sp.]|uniref:malto-oligosyltrehalose synthase n=1 Tax=Castellaniella sp. TaxID=1955812 RepID=UPI00355CBB52
MSMQQAGVPNNISATLRLQLNADYTLDDARSDLPYFSRLGVSHLYLSPISQARRGSTHGYDVVDHSQVDVARGGEDALRRLACTARRAGMGLLLDIVPNHMATDPDNLWWWDVLAQGSKSAWAKCFDIQWSTPGLQGRMLAPFLARPYEDALTLGDIRLAHSNERGLHILASGLPYPLAPGSLDRPLDVDTVLAAHDPGAAAGRARLHTLLERQHYVLADWRSAALRINWRRFFEVSGLIGVRVECPQVFGLVHALPLRLYAEGVIDGLRIDHVDGLAWPLAYCRRLRAAMEAARTHRPHAAPPGPPWVVVEKILAPGESLDERWAVDGTTGYDFAGDVGALQHAVQGERRLFAAWAGIAADRRPVEAWLSEARQELLDRHFVAERQRLLDALLLLAAENAGSETAPQGKAHRFAPQSPLGHVLDALLRHYPTYRSYVEDGPRTVVDQYWFDRALKKAEDDNVDHTALLERLDRWLGAAAPVSDVGRRVVQAFQQLTPPLAAKSLEDTVFYRYGCLLSRNEVGSDPSVFSLSVEAFHAANEARASRAPRGLLATATHDHKRGEDARARLAIVSEIPDEWLNVHPEWSEAGNRGGVTGPSASVAAFRYMLLQALMASWPPDLSADDRPGVQLYFERMGTWAVKAMREGKQLSSWFHPDALQEEAGLDYLQSLAPGGARHERLKCLECFVRRLEPGAIANGLIQAALRLTCPGVPDLYQGTEFRDFSMVDPDNRRPVDFHARAVALQAADAQGQPLLATGRWPASAWTDGRVKQALIALLLRLRRGHGGDFAAGYQPLYATGVPGQHLLAFGRGRGILVVAAVKCASHMRFDGQGRPELPAGHWKDARFALPAGPDWYDVL